MGGERLSSSSQASTRGFIEMASMHLGASALSQTMSLPKSFKLDSKDMSCWRSMRSFSIPNKAAQLVAIRGFAAGGKAKKGSKGGETPKAGLSKEVKSTTVYGANILKEGGDPKILPDTEYPDWLWHLLDKRPPLSELRRKDSESLPFEDLKRYVKLDNRARIKDNNTDRAKS